MNIMCGAAAVGIGDLGRRGGQAVFQFLFARPVRISWLLCTRRGFLHSSDRAPFIGGRGIFPFALVENLAIGGCFDG